MEAYPERAKIQGDPVRAAIEAAQRLQLALKRHDLTIPSLRGSAPVAGRPFVELGGCSAELAESLAAVLEKAQPGETE